MTRHQQDPSYGGRRHLISLRAIPDNYGPIDIAAAGEPRLVHAAADCDDGAFVRDNVLVDNKVFCVRLQLIDVD